jgi:hypothetical protein
MSGCYRCGLSEGSSDRLCETCYSMRFHRGLEVVAAPSGQEVAGIDLSSRGQGAVVAGGALVYAVVVGFFAVTMGRPVVSKEQTRFEIILDKEAVQVVEHSRSFGPVTLSGRALDEKVAASAQVARRR